jgi:hypothetical protein
LPEAPPEKISSHQKKTNTANSVAKKNVQPQFDLILCLSWNTLVSPYLGFAHVARACRVREFRFAVPSFFRFPFSACDGVAFGHRHVVSRMRTKSHTGNSAHPFKELAHFCQILKVSPLPSLNVLDVPAPFRILVGIPLEPDPGDERLNDLRPNHLGYLKYVRAMGMAST